MVESSTTEGLVAFDARLQLDLAYGKFYNIA
jgi:hypothetical protein